mmetsp:Transcript_5395/g.12602  ORF Transcript_5395/g.12602 Transcript_5395/m.12602 type:complete len:241 (+) Transcript_5395:152-874(+)
MDRQQRFPLFLFALGNVPHRHQDTVDLDQSSDHQVDLFSHPFQLLQRIPNIGFYLFQVPIRGLLPGPIGLALVDDRAFGCRFGLFFLHGPKVTGNGVRNGLVFFKGYLGFLFLLFLFLRFSCRIFVFYLWFGHAFFVSGCVHGSCSISLAFTIGGRPIFVILIASVFSRLMVTLLLLLLRFQALGFRHLGVGATVVVSFVVSFTLLHFLIPTNAMTVIIIVVVIVVHFHVGGFHLNDRCL